MACDRTTQQSLRKGQAVYPLLVGELDSLGLGYHHFVEPAGKALTAAPARAPGAGRRRVPPTWCPLVVCSSRSPTWSRDSLAAPRWPSPTSPSRRSVATAATPTTR